MLKPVSSTSTAVIAWPMDPAFDADDEERTRCAEKMADDLKAWRELKVKPGERPTLFTIGVIPPSILTEYEDRCNGSGFLSGGPRILHWLCFKRGVQKIDAFPAEWLYNETEPPTKDPKTGLPPYIDPQWLEKHFSGVLRECGLFVGIAVYRFQDLAGDDQKN